MKDIKPAVRARTKKRAFIALIAFSVAASILLVNILRLSVFEYDKYRDKAFDQLTTTSLLRAERGSIFDANMNPLATTLTTWRVFVSSKEIKARSKADKCDYAMKIAEGLSEILGKSKDDIYNKITGSKVLDITLEKSATEEQYNRIIEFSKSEDLGNLLLTEAQSARYYPEGTMAAHVLGFTGSDNQGLYGLGYYYNSTLRGKDGYYLYAKDANGLAMPGGYASTVSPEDGHSIVTTIDSYVQEKLEEQLEIIRLNHSVTNRVAGIVMDTSTGAILAMATSSPFDCNSPYVLDSLSQRKLDSAGYEVGSDEYKALKNELLQIMWSNKAVSETYEPGSTFKIVTVSAALDSGAAKMSDTFSCPGYHMVGGWRIKCHKTTGHGSGFSLSYGLQMSCNPTMMTIAERIGADRFHAYVKEFGYLEKTGIDLPSEAGTIFHSKENIGSTELATASFGQRFKVSIINQLTAIAAVANGGRLVQPYVVSRIIDSRGNTVSEHETVIRRQIISEEVAAEVTKALTDGVSGNGGAKNAYVEGYDVAAKTGTSQKFDILDANGNSYLRIGSTVAYAPSGGSGIAVILVVDEPQSQVKYGYTVAAPYISDLLGEILPYLEYAPSSRIDTATVSSYVGMNAKSAEKLLRESGIRYEIIGGGTVVLDQLPPADTDITASLSTVYIYTEERDKEYKSVPSLIGLTAEEANKLIANCGLNVKISGVTDTDDASLRVVKQSHEAGTSVFAGTVIEIRLLKTDFED